VTGPVDRYLAELERALPRLGRKRLLTEAEDHLREASRELGEEEAVARFGPARQVAAGLAGATAIAWTRAAILATLALVVLFPAAYPVYESSLPPAPWPSASDMPQHLAWKRDAVLVCFLLAVGAVAAALLGSRRGRPAIAALAAAIVPLAVASVLGTILTVQWEDAVPGTPGSLVMVGIGQIALCVIAAGIVAGAWSRSAAAA
jgi:hypothetical protein